MGKTSSPSAGSPSSPQLTVSVSTTLMQDYRQGAPLADASDLALAWTPAGELEVFAIGLDAKLYVLRRDPDSPTGWRERQVEFPGSARAVSSLATLDVANEHDRMFVLANGYYFEMERDEAGNPRPRYLVTHNGAVGLGASDCGSDVVLVAAPPASLEPMLKPSGVLTSGVRFYLKAVQGEKVRCLSDRTSAWPHLPFVSLSKGTLRSTRGIGESALDASEVAALGSGEGDGFRLVWLAVEDVALPPLAGVTDFTVVRTATNRFWMLATDGSSSLWAISGAADTQLPGGIQWAAAWNPLRLTGLATPAFARVDALRLPDGSIEVMLRDAGSGSLWITGWRPDGSSGGISGNWNEATPLGLGGSTFTANLNDASEMVFGVSSPTTGIRTWWRDAMRDWHPEAVAVPSDVDLDTVHTYRASVNLVDEWNAGVAALPLRVSATDDVALTIGGTRQWIGPGRAVNLTTDATGTLVLTLDIANTLYAPTLIVEGDFLAGGVLAGGVLDGGRGLGTGRLELRADRDVQQHLANLTGTELLAATDALTGQPLLPPDHRNPEDAEQIALTLARVCRELDPTYAPQEIDVAAVGPLKLSGAPRGVRVGSSRDPRAIIRGPSESSPWRFSVRGGRPVFRELSRAEFEALAATARSSSGEVGDFLGIDWGSVLEAIKDGVAHVVEVAGDAARFVVSFVLNGVEHTFQLALDTIEQIFDAVTSIFDSVGIPLDAVVRWLLGPIGFLFDWKKVGAIRDRLRSEFFDHAGRIPSVLADPSSLASYYRGTLEDMRQNIRGWIRDLERSPLGQRSFASLIGPVPALPSYFDRGGTSFFNPASWLLDKVTGGLRQLTSEYGLPAIDGLEQAVDSWAARAREAAGQLTELSRGFWAGDPAAWVANLGAFQSGNVLNLARALADKVVAVVNLLESVLDDLVKILHLAWANATAWGQWLDREIHIPFVSAFYKKVVGGRVSIVDVGCLCVAAAIAATSATSVTSLIAPMADTGAVDGLFPAADDGETFFAVSYVFFHVAAELLNYANLDFTQAWIHYPRLIADFLLVVVCFYIALISGGAWVRVASYVLALCVLDMIIRSRGLARGLSGLAAVITLAVLVQWVADTSLPLPLEVRAAGGLFIATFLLSHLATVMASTGAPDPRVVAGYGILQGAVSGGAIALWLLTRERVENGGAEVPGGGGGAELAT